MKKIFILFLLLSTISFMRAEKYDVSFCYVSNGYYTPWEHSICTAVGGRGIDGKIEFAFYDWLDNKGCFVLKIESLDAYSMTKKEKKKRINAKQPFKGEGYVQYYSKNGSFDPKLFPKGEMGYPYAQWTHKNAKFNYYVYNDHDEIQVIFNGCQFTIALTQHYSTYY